MKIKAASLLALAALCACSTTKQPEDQHCRFMAEVIRDKDYYEVCLAQKSAVEEAR